MAERLLRLRVRQGTFFCLEALPRRDRPRGAIVFVHGLGENRSGHNYTFTELARALLAHGYATYRFDLGGSGDSLLPMRLGVWRRQLSAVIACADAYAPVHLVGRGSARCLLDDTWERGQVFLIRPCRERDFVAWPERKWAGAGPLRPAQPVRTAAERCFWRSLGVDDRFIGGLSVSRRVLLELRETAQSCPPSWHIIFPSCELDDAPARARVLPALTPLFLQASERSALRTALHEVLA